MTGGKVGRKRKIYSIEEKKKAAYEYAACGSARQTSQIVKIPHQTLDTWIEGDETFNQYYEIAVSIRNRIYAGQCGSVFEKIIKELDDRVTNGDPAVVRGVEVGRKKMTGSALALAAGIMFDKNRIGNMQPSKYIEGSKGLEDVLKKTQETLEKFAGKTGVGEKTNATILKIVGKEGAK